MINVIDEITDPKWCFPQVGLSPIIDIVVVYANDLIVRSTYFVLSCNCSAGFHSAYNQEIDMGTAFYEPVKPSSPINQREYLIGGIVVLAIVSMYLLYRKTKPRSSKTTIAAIGSPIEQSKTEKENKETQVVFRSGKLMELMNERERLLLDFIYKHSLDERLTTIEEINKVIGASQRNSEVQKRLRSDIIGAVNDKLEVISESEYNIIDKQRSDFDKRSFEYFIRPEHMDLVEKVLGKKS